ncbi:vacuolar transporter chaperone [Apophysomyces sp. BC1034]|nr:vacuolar transporter chaperone [Apophysomyces sp. BC1015]KAG0179704.1 vacuolar transporter chaperone [Apophysomyces sp. BC1021]KAG0190181.1 vacuolar transporter chaperone [Apophysomyces sp. BC1034]
MKFGSQLRDAIYPEWQAYYIDYDGLKRKLRKAEKDRPFTEKDETEFVEMLDYNLEKVYAFHQEKIEEIKRRTDTWAEAIVSQLPGPDSVAEMGQIQENINEIADDINRLARFSRLNYTGFLKMVKKHDRHTDYVLRPMFMVRLNQCPFWNEDNDALLIKLSELFARVRQGGRTMSFKTSTEILTDHRRVDGRRTVVKRFFVQAENVLELKTYVLRHLPVLVYRDNSMRQENIDPPISSLYLDNADLDAYSSRVESAQGSQIIRLRWYGSAERNKAIAFERRTLAEENRGELKDRFVIKDKYVAGFLRGDQTFLEKYAAKMRSGSSAKSEEEVQKFEQLVTEVQQAVMRSDMQPVLRTYYKRTAFQIPGDTSVRIALDTDLCFIREDSKLFPNDPVLRRQKNEWRRPDVDINYPFENLEDGEVNRYPFATFEIKLDLAPDEDEPRWVVDLEESGILEEAFDFSKFVHGIAVMFDTRVALLPYWLAHINDEVLNQLPVLPSQTPSVVAKQHKGKSKADYDYEDENGGEVRLLLEGTAGSPRIQEQAPATERTSLLRSGQPSASTSSYMGIVQPNGVASRSTAEAESGLLGTLQAVPDHIAQIFQQLFGNKEEPQTVKSRSRPLAPVVLPPGVKVPKKVVTPLRVEPKVFFANERTYFSWMSFGTLLATFSIALFNAGDAVGKLSGIVYTLVSLSTLLYGMGLYYRRRELIRAKAPGPYDDVAGPTVICFALLFAVGLNAYLKLTVKSPTLLYL